MHARGANKRSLSKLIGVRDGERPSAMKQAEDNKLLSFYRMARLIRRVEEFFWMNMQRRRCAARCISVSDRKARRPRCGRCSNLMIISFRTIARTATTLRRARPLTEMVAEFYGKASGANGAPRAQWSLRTMTADFSAVPLWAARSDRDGNGLGPALKYRSEGAIAIAAIGDGALDEGASYHEALNLAALYEIPLLTIVCENKLYAAHTPEAKRTRSRSLIGRVEPFGIPTRRLDGCDIVRLNAELGAVISEIDHEAPVHVLWKSKPTGIAAMSARRMTTGSEYRSQAEIAAWRRRDPVQALRDQVKNLGTSDEVISKVDDGMTETFCAVRSGGLARIPGRDPVLASAALNDVLTGTLELANYSGPRWRARAERIRNRRPDLWAELGQSVILAAAHPVGVRVAVPVVSGPHERQHVGREDHPRRGHAQTARNPCDKCSALIASVTTSGPGTRPGVHAPAVDADLARNAPKAGMVHGAVHPLRRRPVRRHPPQNPGQPPGHRTALPGGARPGTASTAARSQKSPGCIGRQRDVADPNQPGTPGMIRDDVVTAIIAGMGAV